MLYSQNPKPLLPVKQVDGDAPTGQAAVCESNCTRVLHVAGCVTLQPHVHDLVSSACEYHVAL
jgi:hypothetical protein